MGRKFLTTRTNHDQHQEKPVTTCQDVARYAARDVLPNGRTEVHATPCTCPPAPRPDPGARTTAAESDARLTDGVKTELAKMHPDPFTQAAIWRLYLEAPIHLADATYMILVGAEAGPTQ